MAMVIILSHEAQKLLTAYDHRTMSTVITTHIYKYKAQNPLTTANDDQPTLLIK
jgi:hypothetical protein